MSLDRVDSIFEARLIIIILQNNLLMPESYGMHSIIYDHSIFKASSTDRYVLRGTCRYGKV